MYYKIETLPQGVSYWLLENKEDDPSGRPYIWLKDIVIGYFVGKPSPAEKIFLSRIIQIRSVIM